MLIRAQVGFCATDVHIHSGYYTGRFPLIPGHEVVGVVESMGPAVSGLRVGEQVSMNPNIPCGRRAFCRAGRLGLCQDPRGCGSTAIGCFAEFVCVPQALVFSVEGLPLDPAVFTEPAACACTAWRPCRYGPARPHWYSAPAPQDSFSHNSSRRPERARSPWPAPCPTS